MPTSVCISAKSKTGTTATRPPQTTEDLDHKSFLRVFQKAPVQEIPHQCSSTPVVSVVIPTYNQARFLPKTLDSILAQKISFPIEICVGEDNSTDESRAICLSYAEKYPQKIRLILGARANNIAVNGKPTGRFNLTNMILGARGRYIALCEGDDYWSDPEKLAKQVDFLDANQEFSACFHNGQVVWEDSGKRLPYITERKAGEPPASHKNAFRVVERTDFTTPDLLNPYTFIPTASLMFRASCLRRVPTWFFKVLSADIAIASLLSREGKKIKFLNFDGCVYRKHDGGITHGETPLSIYFDRKLLYTHLNRTHGYQFDREFSALAETHRNTTIQWLSSSLHQLSPSLLGLAKKFVTTEASPIASLRKPDPTGTAELPRAGAMACHPHPFTNPPLEPNNADLYWVRSSILRALKDALPLFRGTFLDIGCGVMPYRGLITQAPARVTRYVGLDIETEIYRADVDLRWDGKRIPLEDASVDSAMATEVLEHCPDPLVVLKEARRVLKPGGVFFFTVPYLWPLHDAPYDFFRYTPFSLEKLLADAGFIDVKVQSLGGWNASLAQTIGLWLKRAPMSPEARNNMAGRLWPLYQALVTADEVPADPKAANTMTTGWSGVAFVPATTAAQPSQNELPAAVQLVGHQVES